MSDHLVLYPKSIEATEEFLGYLKQKGWIKNSDGLYDEIIPLSKILDKYLEAQRKEFEEYLVHQKNFNKFLDKGVF